MITARKLLFLLDKRDTNNTNFLHRLEIFCRNKNIDNYFLTHDGYVMMVSEQRKIALHNGVETLRRKLQLQKRPKRVTDMNPLPDSFLLNYFGDGYDESRVKMKFGKRFEDATIENIIFTAATYTKSAAENHCIGAKTTKELVEMGVIPYISAPAVENAKRILEEMKREEELNPDLNGEYTITFRHYAADEEDTKATPSHLYPSKTVTIKGLPGAIDVRKKHRYIYSRASGFGKTYSMAEFTRKYNACFVRDLRNWMGIPKAVQFLIIDEYGPQKKLSFEQLKELTGGNASSFSGNRKSHGYSFSPRDDVQVVILSNKSIYELYGTYNAKLQRLELTAEEASQIDERFVVHRLDGDAKADRETALGPATWSESTFNKELRRMFEELCSSCPSTLSSNGSVDALICYVREVRALFDCRFGKKKMDFGQYANDTIIGTLNELLNEKELSPCRAVTLEMVISSLTSSIDERLRDYNKKKEMLIKREQQAR